MKEVFGEGSLSPKVVSNVKRVYFLPSVLPSL